MTQAAARHKADQSRSLISHRLSCAVCGGDMVGDGYTSFLHCEFYDGPDDFEPDSNPVYCSPLPSQTCPQCLGAGYLDGAIECPNCFCHGEIYCLDDLEVAE